MNTVTQNIVNTVTQFAPIAFDELAGLNDSTSFVWKGLTFNPEEMKDIEEFFHEERFLLPTAKILNMQKIAGNVQGDKGRTDVLFTTTETFFNPLARMRLGLTWTSDFVDNYRGDYDSLVDTDEEDDNDDNDDNDDKYDRRDQ